MHASTFCDGARAPAAGCPDEARSPGAHAVSPAARHAAAEGLVRRHLPDLLRYAHALGAVPELAEDLCQDTMLLAWRKGKQDLPAPALATFLRRALRLRWLHLRRSDRRYEAAIARLVERQWRRETDEERDARTDAARACVEQLDGRAADAVRLAYAESRGRDEIAAALAMRPNGVKTLLARTRRWLQDCIERRTR